MPTRFHNATIWTALGKPLQSELTIHNGFVVSGDVAASDEVDCKGAAILPAFIDGHSHPSIAAGHLLGPDVTHCNTIAEVLDSVNEWVRQASESDWVVGGSYDRSMVKDGVFEANWLDSTEHDRPVVLHASDHHSIWVNSAALSRAGLSSSPGGHGTFFEAQEKTLILSHIPKTPPKVIRQAIQQALASMLELGIVATLDAWVDDDTRVAYADIESPVEVKLAHWITRDNWMRSEFEATQVKFFIDGVLGSATACVSEGYQNGIESAAPVWPSVELLSALQKFAASGCQLHLHAIGDGAVDIALSLLSKIEFKSAPVLVHAELLRDDQIDLIAQLGVWVCSQPLWARIDSLSVGSLQRLSDVQKAQLYRNRDLLDAGALLAFGSDWPVSDVNPLMGIYTAVHRNVFGTNATELNENQRLTLDEAIHSYTAAPAEMLGLERDATLKIGSRGDFVMLDKNPFADNGVLLSQTKVTALFLDGNRVVSKKH